MTSPLGFKARVDPSLEVLCLGAIYEGITAEIFPFVSSWIKLTQSVLENRSTCISVDTILEHLQKLHACP